MKRLALLHPFLFTLASLAFFYQPGVIASPDQVVRPALVLEFALVLLAVPAYWLIRDRDWVAILLTVITLGVFSPTLFFLGAGITSFVVLGLWWMVVRLCKRRMNVTQAGWLLTFVGLILVVAFTIPVVLQLATIPPQSDPSLEPVALEPAGALRDIYYIVLDGYARSDILADLYRFDNSDFERFLESKDFIIPDKSRSNYPKTALSVTSTLNMDYINSFAPGLEEQPFWWLMSPLLDHSRVRASLESLGYQTVSITTDWGITDNPTADIYFSPKPIVLNDFESFLLAKTPLEFVKPGLAKFSLIPSFDSHRGLIRFNIETLAQIPALPGPKFIFAHVISPHPPFVFDADGNPLQPTYPFSFNDASDFPYGEETYRQGYVGQVQFINGQLKPLLETLLRESKTPPIIILQADHGPGMLTDFQSSQNTCLKERFSVFAAYYLPGVDKTVIPDDIVPVNLFRIIFNQYFSSDLPILTARHYYFSGIHIYRGEDVTSRVDTCVTP